MSIEEAVEEKLRQDVEKAEMGTETSVSKLQQAKLQGFTGSICGSCGSVRVKANGSCELCLDCGGTSGCS